MVTTFNKTDLVKFGNFLLDEVNTESRYEDPSGNYCKVSHADIENWMHIREFDAIKAFKAMTIDDVPEGNQEAFMEVKPIIDDLISKILLDADRTF